MTQETRSNEMVEAISALMVQQPFWAVLLFDLMELRESDTDPNGRHLPTACTDGAVIIVNPDFFKKLSVQERIGVLAHEIMHVILMHPVRGRGYQDMGYGPDLKPWNHQKYNQACDYIINATLTASGMQLPLGSLQNSQITPDDMADEVYLKLPDPPEEEKDPSDGGNWDQHLTSPDCASAPDKATIQRAMKMAETAQKSRGDMPAGLQRLVDEICEPQITWTDYIRKTIVTMSGHDEQSYVKPNRRRLANPPHIYWPGRIGSKSGKGAIEIDTSGSIGEHELSVFMGELHGILSDCQPELLYLMYVDAALHGEPIELTDVNELLDARKKAGGGGGTDMTVMFREIEQRQLEVDYAIVLTDGYTPFGEDVGIPTIWCITTAGIVSPWGVSVHVKL